MLSLRLGVTRKTMKWTTQVCIRNYYKVVEIYTNLITENSTGALAV